MKRARLVAFPGDGIGPEVMEEGFRIISLLKESGLIELEVQTFPVGGASLDRFGVPLTQEALDAALQVPQALEEGRFELFYQSIRPLDEGSGSYRHMELLLRMRDEAGSTIDLATSRVVRY